MKASLNHVFRTIWSEALRTWIAVSEITRSRGKVRSVSTDRPVVQGGAARFLLKPVFLLLLSGFGLNAQANPTGAQVVNGTASINQSGSTLNVTNSPGAVINWQGFSINAGETTRFIQQSSSSAVLNRVVGPDPSRLLGTLTSNGQVFLINPAGIMVGQGAVINVPKFVASTLSLSNSDFLAGNMNFTALPGAGGIRNEGSITTPDGGTVYLIAPQVENSGIIKTPKGETILAAGDTVTLLDTGTPGVTVEVTGTANNATNLGQIIADSGQIGVVGAVVKNSGVISANSLVSKGGRIFLKATRDTYVEGGSITATGTTGGDVEVLGNRVVLTGNAALDASGGNGGGTVLVGGDAHGANPGILNSQLTFVDGGTTIKADAMDNGNGGKVVVWSDMATQFGGDISARGGAQSGDGGWVEVSGKQSLGFSGLVDTMAANGLMGSLLLDPTDITISTTTDTGTMTWTGGTLSYTDTSATPSNLNTSTLQTQLASTNVTVDTTSGLGGTGNITVSNAVSWSSANSLTLKATGSGAINVNANINNSSTGGLTLQTASGSISVSNVNVQVGGALTISSGANVTLTDAMVNSTGNMAVTLGGNLGLSSTVNSTWLQSGGDQTITFTGAGANTMTLDASGATVANASAVVQSTGKQTITHAGTLAINVTAGTVTDNTQSAYQWNNGVQGSLMCSSCATFAWAGLEGNGGQDITATTITLNGGSGGTGNNASINNGSSTVLQKITTTGAITITGGSSGGYYNASFPNDTVGNDAGISSQGTQTISAGSISLSGGGGGAATLGGALLTAKGAQSITTSGNLTMNGGNSTATGMYGLGSPAVIGEQIGQSITLNVGGILSMTGGGSAANGALIGGADGAPTINITAGSIGMATLGAQIGVLSNGPNGTLSMSTTSGISQDASSAINTATLTSATASGGAISLLGSNLFGTVTSMSASGNIDLTNAHALTVGNVSSTGGNVTLTTTGAGSHLYLGTASGAVVNATSSGGIYDNNGSGVTNVTASTSSMLISTGALLGNLGVSADVSTPSITASVSGTYGGIRIGNTNANLPSSLSLTDSATTPQGVGFEDWTGTVFTLPSTGWSFSPGTGTLGIASSGAMVIPGTLYHTGAIDLWAQTGGLTVDATASITATGALTLTAGSAWSAVASDIITLNGTISGASITLNGNSIAGTIPAGAIQQTGASTVVLQAVTTAVTTTAPTTTTTSTTTTTTTTSDSPTVAPVTVTPTTTTTSTGLTSTTSGGTTGGTAGTFGGNDPSLTTTSASSDTTSSGTGSDTASGGSDTTSTQADSGSSDASGDDDKSSGKGDKKKDKKKGKKKEAGGDNGQGNGNDEEDTTNANPEQC